MHFTNPIWGYYGFNNNATTPSLFISWAVLIVLSFLALPYFKNQEPFYPDLLILFFVMRVVPFTTLIRFINTPNRLTLLFLLYFSLIFLLTRTIRIKQVPLSVREISKSDDFIFYAGLIFFSAIILFISGYYADFRFHLSFDDVYELRQQASAFDLPLIIKYAWAPATNILPLLFVYFLQKKKSVICIFIILIILLNFSINGMKSTVFKLLICLLFAVVQVKEIKRYYLPVFIVLLFLAISEGFLLKHHFLHDIIIRRAFFIPPLLDTCYYDYITQNGPLYYSRTGTAIQYIIGDIYFGKAAMDCNNGLFSDAYMNLGVLGCIIYPIVYSFLFRFLGSAFRGAKYGLVVFAAIIVSYTLEGSELTTGLLTHGLFLFFVFMYLISIKSNNSRNLQNNIMPYKYEKSY